MKASEIRNGDLAAAAMVGAIIALLSVMAMLMFMFHRDAERVRESVQAGISTPATIVEAPAPTVEEQARDALAKVEAVRDIARTEAMQVSTVSPAK